jgi:hypothetical protein|tara:strand:- start:275 stop:502 length:228 start_codon:yes stop_codon:yes gene_type:complete
MKRVIVFKMKDYFIPKWLYNTSLIIFVAGMVQIFMGNLKWGITIEKNTAIILTYIGLLITLINDLGNYLKKRKKK